MAPYDARMVANCLLDLADEKRQPLTQISLLKILYFCHGWYLVWHDKPLCVNDFEAWELGPVVRSVRNAFKSDGRRPITRRAQRVNLMTGEQESLPDLISIEDKALIEKVFDYYSRFPTPKLIDMTHEKGSPWDRLWNSREPVARLGLRIKNEEIKAHFLQVALPQTMM
jgi:uncharacterized phage-associated protein